MEKEKFELNPLNFGYEPIANFKELNGVRLNNEMHYNCYIKILNYNKGHYTYYMYYYSVIVVLGNNEFLIGKCMLCAGRCHCHDACIYGENKTVFYGQIHSKRFANALLHNIGHYGKNLASEMRNTEFYQQYLKKRNLL